MSTQEHVSIIVNGGRPSLRAWQENNPTGILDLTGAKFTGLNFRSFDLSRANLTGAELTEADLTHAKLAGAILCKAKLVNEVVS